MDFKWIGRWTGIVGHAQNGYHPLDIILTCHDWRATSFSGVPRVTMALQPIALLGILAAAIAFTVAPAHAQDACQTEQAAVLDYQAKIVAAQAQVRGFAVAAQKWQEQADDVRLKLRFAAEQRIEQFSHLSVSEQVESWMTLEGLMWQAEEAEDAAIADARRGQLALLIFLVWKGALADAQRDVDTCKTRNTAKPVCKLGWPGWQGGQTRQATMTVSSNTRCGTGIRAAANSAIDSVAVTAPAHGRAWVEGHAFAYQSADGFHGDDSFTITIEGHRTDTNTTNHTAHVNVAVTVQ
jgi:hypothetical protein